MSFIEIGLVTLALGLFIGWADGSSRLAMVLMTIAFFAVGLDDLLLRLAAFRGQ